MAVRIGKIVFEDHVSIELAPGRWTDTYVLPVRHDWALPPWDYAHVVKKVAQSLMKLNHRGASLWIPVSGPGGWYFGEVKHALRDLPIPFALTLGRDCLPGIEDFSRLPSLYCAPCRGGVPAEKPNAFQLSENALLCLFAMVRLVAAYTSEVASCCLMNKIYCRNALHELEKAGCVEYHEGDPYIDSHLVSAQRLSSQGTNKKNEEPRPYWRIRRPGLSAALRAWGIPSETRFDDRNERHGLLDSPHRRRSRQWPAWLRTAFPHAEVYAGWSEVGISQLRANPDSLVWGKIDGVETLFWLEVESGKSSRQLILDKTVSRWLKAVGYTRAVDVHLVFVFLAQPWVRDAARLAFTYVPPNSAVVVADWSKTNFGYLPFPKWGQVVFE